jgi:DHA2 family multidrug resistance protein-like MFS transporter
VSAAPKATRREWVGLAVLFLPCLLYSMDLTVLHLAVPRITEDLKPSSAQLLWIIDIYGFLVAGSLLTMGTLGDRIGRRRLLLIGAAAFGLASVFAAFSNSAEQLIASRALLGIAGATVAPSTLSLIRNMFLDDKQRTTAIAVWITAYSAGGAVGPVVGGLVLQFFWWGAVFLLAVPVMVLVLVLGPILLPEYRDPKAGRPDLVSAGLSLAAVLTVIFGLKQIAQDGPSIVPAVSILVGIALGMIFVRRQLTLADPLIDLRLFGVPDFSASVATYGLGCLVVFGGFLFIPQYLQLVLGLSPLEAGLWTVPWALAFVAGSMLTPRLARRVRPAHVMAGGLVLAAVGLGAITRFDASTGLAVFVAATIAFALGLAPMFVLTNDLIIGSAPPERAGAASGISETSAELGGALGIAIFGSIGIAVYRRAMDGVVPAEIPPAAAEAARGTLGGAIAAAAQLPDQLGVALIEAARAAFINGMQTTAAISTVGTIGLAIFVVIVVGRVRASAAAEASSEQPTTLATTARSIPPANQGEA